MRFHAGSIAVLLLSCASLSCDSTDTSSASEVTYLGEDTIVHADGGLIAHPTALAVGSDGTLYVLDGQAAQIHRVTEDGSALSSIGMEGSGPGEFRRPTAFQVSGDTLRVIDAGNGRLQWLTTEGEVLGTSPLPPRVGYYISHITTDGRILGSTVGQDSCLAISYGREGQELVRFGIPPVDPPAVVQLGEMREQIRAGGIPDFFRNTVIPFEAPAGQVWLAMLADGALWRFDSRGNRLGVSTLNEPEMEKILNDFFAKNEEDTPRPGVFPLAYIADVQVAGSEVWVLLNGAEEDSAVIVVFSGDGTKLRRVVLPSVKGAKSFAVDLDREHLFLAVPSEAEIIVTDLDRR